MTILLSILSAIAAVFKAVAAGLAFKHELETKANAEHDTQAIIRHDANRAAITNAVANGVHDPKATGDGSSPTTPPPPAV